MAHLKESFLAMKKIVQSEVEAESESQKEFKIKSKVEKEAEIKEATATEVQTIPQTVVKTATQTKKATKVQEMHEILYPVRLTVGENIGNLILPAINQVLPIVDGTNEDELSRGIGHFAGSVLPGENDNSVLSGHRDTVFRELGQLKITDQLIVDTAAGTFTYEIREIKIVPKEDRSIITPTSSAGLTVTTCYPFNFSGSAPDGYVLIAALVNN